jgi:hypothetical protein
MDSLNLLELASIERKLTLGPPWFYTGSDGVRMPGQCVYSVLFVSGIDDIFQAPLRKNSDDHLLLKKDVRISEWPDLTLKSLDLKRAGSRYAIL